LEVGAAGQSDNRDHSLSAYRATRRLTHEILPIFEFQLETGIFVPFGAFGEQGGFHGICRGREQPVGLDRLTKILMVTVRLSLI
jgi:hypothetical protein